LPVIDVEKWDLERLVGKRLSREEILDLLSRVKCEIEVFEGDTISYEAPHDRPDLFSVEGLARAIRSLLGIGGIDFNFVDRGVKAYNMGVPRRPYVAFAIVEDLVLDDEAVKQLMNLQEKLHITYGRGRRKASIGLYDLDSLRLPVYYELRDPLETRFTPLGETREMNLREILEETEKGREYGHLLSGWDKLPVLRDEAGTILSMPPIINSEDTRVTPSTKNVIIDSTGFDPKTVVDIVTVVATSVAERSRSRTIVFVDTIMSSGEVVRAPRSSNPSIKLEYGSLEKLLGIKLGREQVIDALRKMGYKITSLSQGHVVAEPPPYRLDVLRDVDLIEDIAMAIGYDVIGKAANTLPPAYHPGRKHPLEHLSRRLKLLFIGMGFNEVVNYMMSNPYMQNKIFGSNDPLVIVSNPKMEKYTCLRRWLTPGLLEVILVNKEKRKVIKIFEVGDVAIVNPRSETGVRIERRIGYAISYQKATLTDSLAVLKTISSIIGLDIVFEKAEIKGLLRERTAIIKTVDGRTIGFTGEIHPEVLIKLGIENPVVVGEIIVNDIKI